MPEHKITALQLFELAESLVADYDEPKLRQARAVFADLAEKECSGTLLARDAMIGMALAATGHMYDISEISDAATPSPGDPQ
jgi:hypothetical protein